MSKYSFVYPPLGKRLLRAVARRTPGLASRSNRPIGGKRCAARTTVGKPCAAWPLHDSPYCSLHTAGRARELGRKGGGSNAGQAVRAQHSPFHGLVAGVPRGSTLADLLEHDDAGAGAGESSVSPRASSENSLAQPLSSEGDPSPVQISTSPNARLLSDAEDRELFPGAHEAGPVSFYQWTNVDFDEGS